MRIEISRQVNYGAGQQHADIDAGLQSTAAIHGRQRLGHVSESKESRRPIRRQNAESSDKPENQQLPPGLRPNRKAPEHGVSENRQARARLRSNTLAEAPETAAERPTNQKGSLNPRNFFL